jgi:eukaryotic-like serine/threonine-protein kinase
MTGPDQRGYETPVVADFETAVRRLIRFQIKILVGFLAFLLVFGGVVGGVVLYRNSRSVVVPSVRGLDNVGTAILFNRVGLGFGYISIDKASETVPFGQVISTDPPPGAEVKRGTVIRVTFSCGPPRPPICNP